jgi:hypothetical protein
LVTKTSFEPLLLGCCGVAVGKFVESVSPATYILPAESTAMLTPKS